GTKSASNSCLPTSANPASSGSAPRSQRLRCRRIACAIWGGMLSARTCPAGDSVTSRSQPSLRGSIWSMKSILTQAYENDQAPRPVHTDGQGLLDVGAFAGTTDEDNIGGHGRCAP